MNVPCTEASSAPTPTKQRPVALATPASANERDELPEEDSSWVRCASPTAVVTTSDSAGNKTWQSADSHHSNTKWQLVEGVAPAAFATVTDVLGEVFEYCDIATALQLRQVCWAWHDHELFEHFLLATEVLKELREREGRLEKKWPTTTNVNMSMAAANGRKRMSSLAPRIAALIPPPSQPSLMGSLDLFSKALGTVYEEADKFDVVPEGWMVESFASVDGGGITIAVIESERYFPLKGFRKRLLPGDPPLWQRTDNKKMPLPNGLSSVDPHPADWCWRGDWQLHVDLSKTDTNGWSYSTSFAFGTFGPKHKPFVRRREWHRTLVPPLRMLR